MLKRKRLTLDEVRQAVAEYRKVPIRLLDVSLDDAMRLVAQFSIYAYDAYVISCAHIHSAPLITLDNGLKAAAEAAGVTTLATSPLDIAGITPAQAIDRDEILISIREGRQRYDP